MIIKKTWINPKIKIKETKDTGKGMFAKEMIKRGEKVLVWGGNYTSDKRKIDEAKSKGKLVLQWDENLYSIEDRGEDLGYYINHSCDSNTWMKDAYTLIARRNIKIGEEVTVDYGLFENDNYVSKWTCNCGSPYCRKHITGNDWKLLVLQKKYKNHFSPLINKKIKNVKKIFS